MTVPPFDWRVPVLPDAADVPFYMHQLAADIASTLLTYQDAQARAHVESVRPGDASGGVNIPVPLTGALTINPAPAGLYLVAFSGSVKRLPGDGSPVHITITVNNGPPIVEQVVEQADAYWIDVSPARVFVHSGGSLSVSGQATGTLNGVAVKGGTIGTLTRVSA